MQFLTYAYQPWRFALRLLAFWLLFFAFFRIWFLLWLYAEWTIEQEPWTALWQALPLDLSFAGYLLTVPISLWLIGSALNLSAQQFCLRIIHGFNLGVLAILVFLFGANIFIYEEWHTLLNNRALEYLSTPGAMLDSMSFLFKLGSIAAYVGLTWAWWRIYRVFTGKVPFAPTPSVLNLAWLPVFGGLLLLTIRGGLGKMPINESAVYYSSHPFNNHVATNAAWHLIHSLVETRSTKNHYRYFDDETARTSTTALLHSQAGSKEPEPWLRLNPERPPNVVFILMESMTAQLIEALQGEKGICPNLDKLAGEGILFEQVYSSGYRTDQGLVAVLGGFPAQPDQSVVLLEDKAAKLPSVPKTLKAAGYSTAFFYGGQLTFANIGVWLRNQQFETIISGADFNKSARTQRWGADDKNLLEKTARVLNETKEPFFATALTLSLHTPYDVPGSGDLTGKPEHEKFLISAVFADAAVGQFFEQAAQQPWFDNTLFVLVADHGHAQPNGIWMDHPRARQVPLILAGPLIDPAWRGRRVKKLGNHHDIPATVLNAMSISSDHFFWSKDLCSTESPDFAYYSNENGLGWVTPEGPGFFDFSKKTWKNWTETGPGSTQQQAAQAYLQTLYNDFLGL
ncbi:MAG: sulfatase-like hydrolase/transferase [Lewinellaceae bacterium]|nr:sulfatase-like hydrolase/transferase [Lewinellaceae bacterium]